jgi:hypothetical protein
MSLKVTKTLTDLMQSQSHQYFLSYRRLKVVELLLEHLICQKNFKQEILSLLMQIQLQTICVLAAGHGIALEWTLLALLLLAVLVVSV